LGGLFEGGGVYGDMQSALGDWKVEDKNGPKPKGQGGRTHINLPWGEFAIAVYTLSNVP
jgi:hypothetical protein